MIKLNKQEYFDKIHACWIGKNIGGTIGTPFEGKTEMNNVTGFNSPKGEPLGNDDLDLQLVWLCAVEERGIRNITPECLGEYWLSFVPATWNEYGVGKANLSMGILPPFSGEYCNESWKNSNGAWIRTEIWACLFPGCPELAVNYAYNDACVDHGVSEGTYAAVFVCALESAAFIESNIMTLIEKGLSFIPEDCRIAKTVKLAIECHAKKMSLAESREKLVEETKDMGWFQAPLNIGFAILGLLYGDGDFKKTILSAVNCGDDTDCTAATVGSILGIINGFKIIPQDWADYIGDKIVTVATDSTYTLQAKSCTELTERVMELIPSTLKAYGIYTEYTDGETEFEGISKIGTQLPIIRDFEIPETALSYNLPDLIYAKGRVEFDKPRIKANESFKLKFVFISTGMSGPRELHIDLMLPEGWSADTLHTSIFLWYEQSAEIKITPNDNVKNLNKIFADISCVGRVKEVVAPIIIHG